MGEKLPHLRRCANEQQVRDLVSHLKNPQRPRPVVIVVDQGSASALDAERIAEQMWLRVDVYVVPARLSKLLQQSLPTASVFGNAARTYPCGLGWLENPQASPYRACGPKADPREVEAQIVADALAAAPRPATPAKPADAVPNGSGPATVDRQVPVRREGIWKVRTAEEGRALAEHLRSLRQQPVVVVSTPSHGSGPLIDVEDLHGRVKDLADVVLLENGAASWAMAAALPDGMQVYGGAGRVYSVDLGWLRKPWSAPFRFCWPSSDPRKVADLLEDDVLGGIEFRVTGPETESKPGMSVLPGGPPWLLPRQGGEDIGIEEDSAPVPPSQAPPLPPFTAARPPEVVDLEAQVRSLSTLVERHQRNVAHSTAEARQARETARGLQKQVRSLMQELDARQGVVYADPERQFRYEVEQAWLRRVPEFDRDAWPLRDYRIGGGFLRSVDQLQGISRAQVVDAVVDVATDRVRTIPGRELHQLRETEESQKQRVRRDGAKAWRCSLQGKAASSRRLHFWRLPDGTVELDGVAIHDDV